MPVKHPRLAREARTLQAMIEIYCRGNHSTQVGLCPGCQQLTNYALARLDRCPFQENKSTCANCKVHCYKPEVRKQIRVVMRYSGPRILWKHPILAVMHLLDGKRPSPALAPKKKQPTD